MRIVIDLQGAQTESRFRGIGRYSVAHAQALVRNAGNHEVWIVVNETLSDGVSDIRRAFEGLIPEERIVAFSGMRDVGWPDPRNSWRRSVAELARESFIAGLTPDIVHVTSLFEGAECPAVTSVGRLQSTAKTAVTLYDLIPLLNEDTYLTSDWSRRWYMDKVGSLRKADLLLAISGHAREEALEALHEDPAKIVNISSAISPEFEPVPVGKSEREFLESRFGILGTFAMYSGAMEPRKNADRLLQAFAKLNVPLRATTQLVIAGKVSSADARKYAALGRELGIEHQIVLTGYVTDDELRLLYSAASVYVFPSLHEGFGLPALEAMACGAPTIGSSTTSVPEVIGRADALFDPMDTEEMAAMMTRVLTEPAFSNSLKEHATRQAAKFSWDATARNTIAAFERICVPSRAATTSWPAVRERLAEGYQQLVRAIADLPGKDMITDTDVINASTAVSRNLDHIEHLARARELPQRIAWRIEGPFDSSYSLALVNRELALALTGRGHDVALHSSEGPGDFAPDEEFLRERAEVAALHERSSSMGPDEADVSSRLLYPPRVRDMRSRQNLLHLYAWEESGFPQEWVEDFNVSLQGVSCLSRHVRKILIDNGVAVPVTVGGCGVDHWDRIQEDCSYPLPEHAFKFLHVSSCFPRKGVDVLLDAYGRSFSKRDDVLLIIKTFQNPHNKVHEWLDARTATRSDFPAVMIIEDDLPDAQLKGIYARCHAMVAPSRAEGFGLPLAEAMLSGLPVITTGWGGQLDFCNDETAWLVDYRFGPARTHFDVHLSAWAEPDPISLAKSMRDVRAMPKRRLDEKIQAAKALLRRRFRWSDIAKKVEFDARRFAIASPARAPKVGWVTTWKTRCGVAGYSEALLSGIGLPVAVLAAHTDDATSADVEGIYRCWVPGDQADLDQLSRRIDALSLDMIVVQFQYGFFDFVAFEKFVLTQLEVGRKVVVMMHSTSDSPLTPRKKLCRLADVLSQCSRVLVHSIEDLNNLKQVGVVENVALFPHGIIDAPEPVPAHARGVLARGTLAVSSYGFFLPHKGLLELIEAVALLVGRGTDVRLRMLNAEYPSPASREHIEAARSLIDRLGLADRVVISTAFTSDEETVSLLSDSDLIVYPYQSTGESSSAAVRHGIASGRPVAVTPLGIFDDVKDVVHYLPGVSPEEIADGIMTLADKIKASSRDLDVVSNAAERWRRSYRMPVVSRRLRSMLVQLAVSPSDGVDQESVYVI